MREGRSERRAGERREIQAVLKSKKIGKRDDIKREASYKQGKPSRIAVGERHEEITLV